MIGSSKVLYIRETSSSIWQPVGCLISWNIDEESETLDTTTRYSDGWESSIITEQQYIINATAISNKVDFKQVNNYQSQGTKLQWQIGDEYGVGYVTSTQIENNVDEVVQWSLTITGENQISDFNEFSKVPLFGQLPVFADVLGTLLSSRQFWYLRGYMDVSTSLIGVLSGIVEGEDLVGDLNVSIGLNATLESVIIPTLLDATYTSAFDFGNYYDKVLKGNANVGDYECFKKAIFEITGNGGDLINSTITANLISSVIYTELRSNTTYIADWDGVLDKYYIYASIEGVLNASVNVSSTLTKATIYAELIGDLDISSSFSGTINTEINYVDIVGDMDIDASFDATLETTLNVFTYAVSNNGESSSFDSCLVSVFYTDRYSDDSTLSVGSFIYINNTLTIKFNGNNLWYKISNRSYRIDNNGEILQIFNC